MEKDWQAVLRKFNYGDGVRMELKKYFAGRKLVVPKNGGNKKSGGWFLCIILLALLAGLFMTAGLLLSGLVKEYGSETRIHYNIQNVYPQTLINESVTQIKEKVVFGESRDCVEIKDVSNGKLYIKCD